MDIGKIVTIAVVMLVIDILFLYNYGGYLAEMIQKIQNKKFSINYPFAAICYTIMVFAFYYFITLKEGNSLDAFILGFCIYAIYETTNKATFVNWQFEAVIYDSLWGGTLFILTKTLADTIERLTV